jgi:hypothetical protein
MTRFSAILLAAALSCLLAPLSVLGQRTDFSDNWLVQSNGSITGCGVTDETYPSYGHEYTVTATLTSPTGRTHVGYGSSGSCGTGNPQCSRADVSLNLIDSSGGWDLGEYFIESFHEGVCPYYTMGLPEANTNAGIILGVSISVLTKAATSNFYTRVAHCNVHCPTDGFLADQNHGQFIASAVPYTYRFGYICGPVNAVAPTSPSTPCQDIEGYVSWPTGFPWPF